MGHFDLYWEPNNYLGSFGICHVVYGCVDNVNLPLANDNQDLGFSHNASN